MRDGVPWDPIKDFAPITLAITSPNLLVVHPSMPVNTVKDLIALAKRRPGELNDAGGQTGSSTHLAAELFKAMADVNIVRVPYKGVGPALNALIGGEAQLSFTNPGAAAPHVKAKRLRAVAVTSAQPSALLPGLTTVAASGLPGYEAVSIFGMFAPAKTPTAIIDRLYQEMARALAAPDVKEKFLASGVETVGSSPDQLANAIKAEMSRMGKVIKDRNIRAE
jgi:tripartite-type tricarboxylate transporter receptor subunit TctC